MAPGVTSARRIGHEDVNCASCAAYADCKALEVRFAAQLAENGGNWRAVFYPEGGRVGTPTRRCARAMLARHAHRFDDRDVLEVGCGEVPVITEEFCRQHRTRYVGIDVALPVFQVAWLPGRRVQHRVFRRLVPWGLHARSPHRRFIFGRFPSPRLRAREFDVICGTSTIEHWHEDLTDRDATVRAYRADLRECFSLLRPGGVLVMNAPMFIHGNIWFMRGDVVLVESFFGDEWTSVTLEHWRERHDDLAPYCPAHRRDVFRDRYGIELTNMWSLNIVAVK